MISQVDLTIRDYVTLTQECDLPITNEILSSDELQFDILFEPNGGQTGPNTHIRHQYYRQVTIVFVNSSGAELNPYTFDNHNLSFDKTITIDESMLEGLPNDEYIVDVSIRYSRNSNLNNPHDPVQRFFFNGTYVSQFHLPTNQDEYTENLYNVLCFKYHNCHNVRIYPKLDFARTAVTHGSGNFEYNWAIDGVDIAVFDDRTRLLCGLHTYSVTVTDPSTGCEVVSSRQMSGEDCQEVLIPCTTGAIKPVLSTLADGAYKIDWNEVEKAVSYKVKIIPSDPSCCGGEVKSMPIIIPVSKSEIVFKLPESRCFSYEIIPICESGEAGKTSGKKCYAPKKVFSRYASDIIKIFPNPAAEYLNVLLGEDYATATVTVYDMNGRQVLKNDFKNNSNLQIETSELNSGTYLLKLSLNEVLHSTNRIVILK